MKNTYPKEISVNHLPAKAVVPPYMAAPLPAIVSVLALGEFLANNHLRAVRCYWTARREFIVEVAPGAAGEAAPERKDAIKDRESN